MRVLIASNSIGLYQGGHGKNIFHLALELKKLGINVTIFTWLIHDESLKIENDIRIVKSKLKNYSIIDFSKELSKFIIKNNFDIIHSNGSVNYHYFENYNIVPTVFHARSHNFSNFKALLFDKFSYLKIQTIKNIFGAYYEYHFDKKYLKKHANIIANCEDVKNRIINDIGNIKSIRVIHNAVRIPKNYLTRKPKPKSIRIGYLANFYPIKGWDYLIKVICETVKKDKSIKFELAGSGILTEFIKTKLNHLILSENVNFLGRLDSESKKLNFFNTIDYFICPAHAPTTVTEALSHGIPVFHFGRWFDCGDGMDIHDFDETGMIFSKKDVTVNYISEKLVHSQTIFNKINKDKTYKILKDKYDWCNEAKKTKVFYNDIIKKCQRRSC